MDSGNPLQMLMPTLSEVYYASFGSEFCSCTSTPFVFRDVRTMHVAYAQKWVVQIETNLVSNFLSSTALFSERRNVWKQKRLSHNDVLLVGLLHDCCGTMCPCCIHACGSCNVWAIGAAMCSRTVSYTHLTLPTICSV